DGAGEAAGPGAARGTRAAARPAAAASKPSPQAEALRREIATLHAGLGERDHYELLGLARSASLADVKSAYFAAAKRFHPDALGALGLHDARAQAQAVFARIVAAYETLSDPARRRDYDLGLDGEADGGEGARLMQAESLYRKAEVML